MVFTITEYAGLHDGLEDLEGGRGRPRDSAKLDRPPGRREIDFELSAPVTGDESNRAIDAVDVFSTRPETIYGATYLAVSPGHDLARALADRDDDIADYVETVRERRPDEVGFSGVETDVTAVHP